MIAPTPGSLNALKDEEERKLDFIWKRASMENGDRARPAASTDPSSAYMSSG
jgi:hypothetical protein